VVRFYSKHGTTGQWTREGKQAVKMTRLSCHWFRSNEVRLWLSVIVSNLGNLWWRLVLPKGIGTWSLTSLQQRLVKHTRYYWCCWQRATSSGGCSPARCGESRHCRYRPDSGQRMWQRKSREIVRRHGDVSTKTVESLAFCPVGSMEERRAGL
jgi:hypothetical protein